MVLAISTPERVVVVPLGGMWSLEAELRGPEAGVLIRWPNGKTVPLFTGAPEACRRAMDAILGAMSSARPDDTVVRVRLPD